ncbi:MAG TPA: hypothetical protein VF065_09075, partial [Ilumatobacter sp.]
DIHDPANPFEVVDAFMPTSIGSFAGEGIQVISVDNEFFSGDLLIHQNETCPFGPPPTDPLLSGGISMWDVSDPTNPTAVTAHTGDFAGGLNAGPNQTHSMYAWHNNFDGRWYVVLGPRERSRIRRRDPLILSARCPQHRCGHARVRGRCDDRIGRCPLRSSNSTIVTT